MGGAKVGVGVGVTISVGVGVSVGKEIPAITVRVAIWPGESWPTGEGVQVGGMIAGTSVGVGVGSPTSIWPKEQARLVDNNKMARTPSAARFTDLEASFIVGWWAMDAVDDGRVPA